MKKPLYYFPLIMQKFGFIVFYVLHKIFVSIEIRGRENLVGLKKPVIMASNHTGELDVTVSPLVLGFFNYLYPLYFVSNPKEKLKSFGWRNYLYGGFFFNILGGYPINSGFRDYGASLETFINLLKKGNTVFIFPEGKRSTNGDLSPARGGLGFMVYETNATVVPIVINTFYKTSWYEYFLRRKKVIVEVLKPIESSEITTSNEPTVDDYRKASKFVLDKIKERINTSNNKFIGFVDFDKDLELEKNSSFRSFFNFFFIPIINSLPKKFNNLIKKSNKSASIVLENAATHTALEVLYSKGKLFSVNNFFNNFFKYIWFNINNSKAVRNRLKFVKREIKKHLECISDFDRDIEIISIASGSSRSIIEVVKEGHYKKGTKLSITFLDKSEKAIKYSKDLSVHISHMPINLNWIQDSVGHFLQNSVKDKYDVVEIVGLLDYFDDNKVTEIFTGIYNVLQVGGILIASNINHNSEEKFITKVVDWPMQYKTVEHLAELANKAGFDYNKMEAFYEPLKIHGLVVAKK